MSNNGYRWEGGSKYDATHDAASMETMCTKKKSGGSGKQQSTQDPRVSDGVRRKPQNQFRDDDGFSALAL